nr:uncharacterized protein LOC119177399 [Rhipicephalus microplus]
MENQNEDTASDNDVSSSLGLAMARIVAKLMDKYNSSLAFFRDDMLFWNWAREESNEPILQAIGTNTEAFASKKKPGMDKSTLFNAGQGDCMPEHPIDDISNAWPGEGPHVEHPMSLEFGEIDDRPFLGSGNDYLTMGDFMIPADDGDEYWGRGFDPTQQFDFLDSDEDMITAEEPTAKCSAPLPPIGTRRKRTQMETTVTMSEPEENFGNTPGDTWHPTWIENLPRACPDAEVSPIFLDISRKVANSFNGTGARPKERPMNFSSGSHGTSSDSSFNLTGNTFENSSLTAMFPSIRIRSQDELDAAQWPWKLNSNGELTTVGPWLPLQVGSELSSFPVVRSGYLDALRKELEGEIDELLFNLFEITQPWVLSFSAWMIHVLVIQWCSESGLCTSFSARVGNLLRQGPIFMKPTQWVSG